MTTNNELNEFYFDQVLAGALKQQSEQVPSDFTTNMLEQIRKAQEQEILSRVIWQERLTLGASIALASLMITGGLIFRESIIKIYYYIVNNLTTDEQTLFVTMPRLIKIIGSNWQQYAILAVISMFALYSLADFLTGHRIRIR